MNSTLTEQQKEIIKNNTNIFRKELSILVNCDIKQIICYERSLNIIRPRGKPHTPTYQHTLNHNYFENINTEDQAYIIGFIFADGSINTSTNRYMLRIELQERDKDILSFIKKELNSSINIKTHIRKNKRYVLFQINSKKMITDLIKIGILPGKTYLKNIPLIPLKFAPDFLRGLFDGDGSICTCKAKDSVYSVYYWSIASKNKEIFEQIKTKYNINFGEIRRRFCHNNEYFEWKTSNRKVMREIYNYMYYDKNLFCLLRKRNKMEEIING
jgi:DNA-binding transcriptional regulator WhiA